MKLIRYNLWRLKRVLSPPAVFKKQLWLTLSAQIKKREKAPLHWYTYAWARFRIAIVSALVAATTFGTSMYAYASPDVTEGTVLYPVKHTLEKVEEKLTPKTPEAQAKLILKKIQRREAEKVVMERRQINVKSIEKKIERLDNELEITDVKLASSTDNDTHRKVEQRLEKRRENLEKRQQKWEDKKEKLLEKISTSTTPFERTTPKQRRVLPRFKNDAATTTPRQKLLNSKKINAGERRDTTFTMREKRSDD